MNEEQELIYFSCANYKSGKYILNRYRKIDIIIPIVSGAISFFAFFSHLIFSASNASLAYIGFLALVFLVPFILTFPIPNYQCTYLMIYQKIDNIRKQKVFEWGGWNHEG